MPLFHFHIDDGVSIPDPDGTELRSAMEAKRQAVAAAGEMLSDLDGDFWRSGSPWTMHVTDEAGLLIFSLSFSAFQPSGEVRYLPKEERG